MEWYVWVLIIVGLIGLGALKLYVFGKIKAKKKPTHHDEDE